MCNMSRMKVGKHSTNCTINAVRVLKCVLQSQYSKTHTTEELLFGYNIHAMWWNDEEKMEIDTSSILDIGSLRLSAVFFSFSGLISKIVWRKIVNEATNQNFELGPMTVKSMPSLLLFNKSNFVDFQLNLIIERKFLTLNIFGNITVNSSFLLHWLSSI